MIVALLMAFVLLLVIQVLLNVIRADQQGSTQNIGFLAYKDENNSPVKDNVNA